jgi:hypothetical protein
MKGTPALENTAEANGLGAEDASPSRILDIGYAFWRSKALLSAVELDVFTILAEGSQHLDSLVGRVELAADHPHDLARLQCCSAMDLQSIIRNCPANDIGPITLKELPTSLATGSVLASVLFKPKLP